MKAVTVRLSLAAAVMLRDTVAQVGRAGDAAATEAFRALDDGIDAAHGATVAEANGGPVDAEKAHIAYGRLQGFEKAVVHGIPGTDILRGLVSAYREWLEIVDRGVK